MKPTTREELVEFYEEHYQEFLKFERVPDKLNDCADLHAFLLLDRLVPDERGRDIVAGAEHGEIYLRVEPEDLLKIATKEDLINLHRCGVRCDEANGLCMYA